MMKWGYRKSTRAWVERWAPYAGFVVEDQKALNLGAQSAVDSTELGAELAYDTGGLVRPPSGQETGISALVCALMYNPKAISVVNQDRFSVWLVELVLKKNVRRHICAQLAYAACPNQDYEWMLDALQIDPVSMKDWVGTLKPFGSTAA